MIVKLKINLSKADRTKLFKGEKGTYLDATLFINDQPDQYGNDGMITQDVTKEEREQGVKGAILGNCKIVGQQQRQQPAKPQQRPTQQQPQGTDYTEDDIPF